MSEIEPLADGLVEDLCRPDAHPLAPSSDPSIEHIQTHISHLFLTAERVYKLRKAVDLPFLSFATRAERNADCLREVELNRRLARDVYLGVAPVRKTASGFVLGAPGEGLDPAPLEAAVEHCVVMRRLPAGRDALSLLRDGKLEATSLDALADRLASFHRDTNLGRPAPFAPAAWLDRVRAPVRATFDLMRGGHRDCIDRGKLDRCERAMDALFQSRRESFLARRESGRVVDGHGDLHLDHVWLEPGRSEPLCIDCVEFDDDLRRVDVAAELAFLVMDLGYRGRPDLGERVLRRYAAVTDDWGLYEVVDYHVAHRALVRASVAAVATDETEIGRRQRDSAAESARRHLQLALDWLERAPRPRLVLMAGLVGSGKSTVAEALADDLPAAVIASDRVRKHLAGLAPDARVHAGPGLGLYSAEQVDEVYRALLTRAESVIGSGRVTILDATWSRRTWRDMARRFAEVRGIPIHLVEARCGESETLARLVRRARDPGRISDAGPELYAESAKRWEPPDEWKADERSEVWTDRADWRDIMHGVRAQIEQGGDHDG